MSANADRQVSRWSGDVKCEMGEKKQRDAGGVVQGESSLVGLCEGRRIFLASFALFLHKSHLHRKLQVEVPSRLEGWPPRSSVDSGCCGYKAVVRGIDMIQLGKCRAQYRPLW